jgi:hypothetical protein
MTDHQLSTRDLAAPSDRGEAESSPENERAIDDATSPGATSDPGSGVENGGSDLSLTRDPATGDQGETRAADSGAGSAVDEGLVGSAPGDARVEADRGAGPDHEPLFSQDQSEHFTSRWQEIQTSFVDHPRDAVAKADTLVADLMQRLAASFSQERERLEGQWDLGDDVSTEDLRVALTRYRSFFDRLLSA